jgi:predicted PurR-regulated permease PerM
LSGYTVSQALIGLVVAAVLAILVECIRQLIDWLVRRRLRRFTAEAPAVAKWVFAQVEMMLNGIQPPREPEMPEYAGRWLKGVEAGVQDVKHGIIVVVGQKPGLGHVVMVSSEGFMSLLYGPRLVREYGLENVFGEKVKHRAYFYIPMPDNEADTIAWENWRQVMGEE